MSEMPDYKEKARRVYDKLGTGSLYDSERIEVALREAHEAGRRDERERCAGIARNFDAWPQEGADIAAAILSEQGDV